MGILFNNSADIDEFASRLGATSFSDPKTGQKVYTTYYLKLQEKIQTDLPPPPANDSFITPVEAAIVKT